MADSYHHPLGGFGRITQGVKDHQKQTESNLQNWQSKNAIDLSVQAGTPVYAVADGKIGTLIGPIRGNNPKLAGNRISLVTKTNEFYYAHLSELNPALTPGTQVHKGQLLGYSGKADGVEHLHFAAKRGNPEVVENKAWHPFDAKLQEPDILKPKPTLWQRLRLRSPASGSSLPFRRLGYNLGVQPQMPNPFGIPSQATNLGMHFDPNRFGLSVPKLQQPGITIPIKTPQWQPLTLTHPGLGSALPFGRPEWGPIHHTGTESSSGMRFDPNRFSLGTPKLQQPGISTPLKVTQWEPLKLTQPALGSSLTFRRPDYNLGNFQLRPPSL